jgi:hypothetical protein
MNAASFVPLAPPIAARARPLEIGSYSFEIEDGVYVIGSVQHYRPDEFPSTAHRAFVQLVSRSVPMSTSRKKRPVFSVS